MRGSKQYVCVCVCVCVCVQYEVVSLAAISNHEEGE